MAFLVIVCAFHDVELVVILVDIVFHENSDYISVNTKVSVQGIFKIYNIVANITTVVKHSLELIYVNFLFINFYSFLFDMMLIVLYASYNVYLIILVVN